LLEGKFTSFFGATADTSSFSGALLEQVRTVAREDLPVRKFDRRELQGEKLIATTQEKDFEFSRDDLDIEPIPDPPAGFDTETPGENY
jgi:hypothetical protein